MKLRASRIKVADSLEAVNQSYYRRGWTDGLPIVPPTPERVEQMLALCNQNSQEVVGIIPPRWGKATVEKIAINAVMAGCLPDYLPVLVAAVEALTDKPFNLYAIQATTNPVAPLAVVNGPVRKELDINSGYNALGQSWRANATIGRAIRLVLLNIGGSRPGVLDRATMGQPGKYSFCFGENEEASPWLPLHKERGYDTNTSTVTVVGATGTFNILDMGSNSAESLLNTIAGSMTGFGSNNFLFGGEPLVLICPEHARLLASDGFSKQEAKRYLYQRSQVPLGKFSPENIELIEKYRGEEIYRFDSGTMIPLATQAQNIMIVVTGGAGPHSVFIPTFGDTEAITKPITQKPPSGTSS